MKNYLPKCFVVVPAMAWIMTVPPQLIADNTVSQSVVRQSPAGLSDRLVLAVGGSSYSERRVVAWMIVRELLREDLHGKSVKSSPSSYLRELHDNWTVILNKFSEDMLVKQEASRLGSSAPSERVVVAVSSRVDANRKLDRELNLAMVNLGIDEDEKLQIIGNVLQVESFRSARDRNRAGRSKSIPGATNDASAGGALSSSLLTELKSRYPVRVYLGANTPGPVLKRLLNADVR